MNNLLWENKIIVCDLCKKNEIKKTIKINGEWKGICNECEPKEEPKLDK